MAEIDPALHAIARERSRRQLIANPIEAPPEAVVSHLLAMQAQDYSGSKWAIGLRTRSLRDVDIEQALADHRIVRTWPMRGTLHVVAAVDLRWLVSLLAPRSIAGAATRRRQLGIDADVQAEANLILERELAGGRSLTRTEIYERFERGGIRTADQRGIHLIGLAAQNGLICSGAQRDKQPTFSLVDEVIPPSPALERDAAMAELAVRYLAGHGPATAQDLSWWSGLTLSDSRAALMLASDRICVERIGGVEYWRSASQQPAPGGEAGTALLPGFDEILLGYRDRSASLAPAHKTTIVPGANGMFRPCILHDGRILGTWNRSKTRRGISITPEWFPEVTADHWPDLTPSANRLGSFLQEDVALA